MNNPRIGIEIATTTIKATWINSAGQTESIVTIPLPVKVKKREVSYSPAAVLDVLKTIPERFRFAGQWQAALATERSTFIFWDRKSGEPLTALIGSGDRRGAGIISDLTASQRERIRAITGRIPEAGYPFSKICWFLNQDSELKNKAARGEVCYGSLDSWLVWKASGGNIYQLLPAQADQTLFYNPFKRCWSQELLDEFDVPAAIFPEVVESVEEPVDAEHLWPNAKIVGLTSSHNAAIIGSQPPPYEQTRVSLGGEAFVSLPVENEVPGGLLSNFTPTPTGRIKQAEGIVHGAGKTVDWLTRVLGVSRHTFAGWIASPWPEQLPLWCPELNAVGAPFWSDRAASLRGFTGDTSAKEICQGLLVSIIMRVGDILDCQDDKSKLRILLDGDLARLANLPPLAAAIWDLPTAQVLNPHLAPRGALIYSHWNYPYFRGDPWRELNMEVVIPTLNLPVAAWKEQWQQSLQDWGLNRPDY